MRIQPSLLASAIALALTMGAAHAEQNPMPTNPGQTGNPPLTTTPTWTIGAQNITIKQKSSNIKGATDPGSERTSGGAKPKCPDGTYWYEPAKNCVAVGGHPTERAMSGGGKPIPRPTNCTFPPCPGEETSQIKQSTSNPVQDHVQICPPYCGSNGQQATNKQGNDKPGRPVLINRPQLPKPIED